MSHQHPSPPGVAPSQEAALAAVDIGLITTDHRRRITSWSEGAERIFGFTESEAIGSTADELPTVTPQLAAATRDALSSAPRSWLERDLPLLRKDGSTFPGRLRMAMTHDDAGEVTGSVVLVSDTSSPRASPADVPSPEDHGPIAALGRLAITGIDRAELLEQALAAVAGCLEIELAAVVMADPEGGEIRFEAGRGWDPRVEGERIAAEDRQAPLLMAGTAPVTAEDISTLGLSDQALLARHGVLSCAGVGLRDSKQRAGALVVFSRRVRRYGRSEIEFLQAVAHVLSAAADRARAVELEKRLERFSRMEALGQLTGGIAHDFNNLLAVILSYASFAREEAGGIGDSSPEDSLRTIESAAQRAAELTHQLLVFSRQELVETEPIDVAATIAGVSDTIRDVLGEGIELRVGSPPEQLTVEAGDAQLEQIVFSLAFNARDAMPDGGEFTIAIEAAGGDETASSWVRLTLTDTGTGMSREVVEKAFDPFFTTKPVGGGPGLGLSTVHGMVASMGGSIGLSSEPGQGTAVDILLPAYDGAEIEVTPDEEQSARPRVLLIEDDEMVRRLAVRVLEEGGYAVVAKADVRQAVEFARSGEGADVVLTDIVLPGSSGTEISSAIKPHLPDAAVVFMSGYSASSMPAGLTRSREAIFVAKPFTPETLLAGIGDALARSGGGGSAHT